MKSKLLFGLIAIAMLLTMFIGVSSAESANSVGDINCSIMEETYYATFDYEGQYKYFEPVLYFGERDTFIMTLSKELTITVIVADCCLMGDTIAAFYPTPTTLVFEATSPKIIMGTAKLKAGTYEFYVGYTYSSTMTLMGYYVWIIVTCA